MPQPLTLEYALGLADEPHPDLLESRARLALARAEHEGAAADDDATAVLSTTLAWADEDRFGESQDHAVGVAVRKRLYDFGYSATLSEAAAAGVRGFESRLLDARQQRRVAILEAFFDVVLADLAFARDNEAMALQFVRFDRLRDRHELKQASDLELFEAEATYQEFRSAVMRSRATQRTTRVRLAELLNRPQDSPSDVARPTDLSAIGRDLVDVESLQASAAEHNPRLVALRAELDAAARGIEAAQAASGPVLRAELDAGAQSRSQRSSANDWRAGIVLDIPLYEGGRAGARIARAEAEHDRVRAELARHAIAVRRAVVDLWVELDVLQRQREVDAVRRDFTELNLDRSRTLYQMEAISDLGDSMVMTSEARLQTARTEFDIALAWVRLDALTGKAPEEMVSNLLGSR
ncbi:MAG: TolC family protein [Gammaproteobacteria bacterium]|nr:TolC family protein [Gammaproteobacteria bacterium]